MIDSRVRRERGAGLGPRPVTTLNTPPESLPGIASWAIRTAVRGVSSAGFTTAQLPVARAGATPRASSCIG